MERRNADVERADYHAALICAVLANINRDPKRTPRAFTSADFMPQPQRPEAEASDPDDHLNDLLALAGSLGAEVVVQHD